MNTIIFGIYLTFQRGVKNLNTWINLNNSNQILPSNWENRKLFLQHSNLQKKNNKTRKLVPVTSWLLFQKVTRQIRNSALEKCNKYSSNVEMGGCCAPTLLETYEMSLDIKHTKYPHFNFKGHEKQKLRFPQFRHHCFFHTKP